MSKKSHKISQDLKADILKRVKEEGIPVTQAAQEHGIHETTIYNWLIPTDILRSHPFLLCHPPHRHEVETVKWTPFF